MSLKSAEAVKKGHIVKDTGISTNLKTCQDKLLGRKKKTCLGKRVHMVALLCSSNRCWQIESAPSNIVQGVCTHAQGQSNF